MSARTARIAARRRRAVAVNAALAVTCGALIVSLTTTTLGMLADEADAQPVAPHPAPVAVVVGSEIPAVTVSDGPEWAGDLPACADESALSCYWDATQRGNGEGMSYTVDANGRVFYVPDGTK
jgi:hypothetical protein